MPSGADVETAVREHLSIFYPDHPALLAALRAEAAAVMRDLAEAGITAYLAGPVLNGAATDDSNITLECFAESGKDAELALLNLNINWEPIDPQATPSLHPIEALGWLRPIRRGSRSHASSPSRTRSESLLKCCRSGISARIRGNAPRISIRPISRLQAARHSTTFSACCATPHIIRINLFLRIWGFLFCALSLTIAVGDF